MKYGDPTKGTVGRQDVERELLLHLLTPWLVLKRLIMFGVFADDDRFSRRARADLTQQLEKLPECFGIGNFSSRLVRNFPWRKCTAPK